MCLWHVGAIVHTESHVQVWPMSFSYFIPPVSASNFLYKKMVCIYHVQKMNNVLDLHLQLFLKMDMILKVMPNWQIWYIQQVPMSVFPSCTAPTQWMSNTLQYHERPAELCMTWELQYRVSQWELEGLTVAGFHIFRIQNICMCLWIIIFKKHGKGRYKYLSRRNAIIICRDKNILF